MKGYDVYFKDMLIFICDLILNSEEIRVGLFTRFGWKSIMSFERREIRDMI